VVPPVAGEVAREIDCKLLRGRWGVQLIVFVEAIQKIFKRENYEGDKESFWLKKTKGE
jgi:hypothetical protein